MATEQWQGILVGLAGILTLIALIFLVIRADSRKGMSKDAYRKGVRPALLAFLALDVIFGVGLMLVIDLSRSTNLASSDGYRGWG